MPRAPRFRVGLLVIPDYVRARPQSSPAERERLQALLERAERARSAGRWGEGLAALEEARSLDARHAGATFRRGEVLLELGRPEEARRAFLRARDEDICPLRAPSAIVELVRDVAAERSAPLVDFARFAAARSEWTIPGDALFLDTSIPRSRASVCSRSSWSGC